MAPHSFRSSVGYFDTAGGMAPPGNLLENLPIKVFHFLPMHFRPIERNKHILGMFNNILRVKGSLESVIAIVRQPEPRS